jgi:hypothetical protein
VRLPVFARLLALAALITWSAGVWGQAKVVTRGTAEPDVKWEFPDKNSTGSVSVFSRADDVINGSVFFGNTKVDNKTLTKLPIEQKTVDKKGRVIETLTIPGIGQTKKKFVTENGNLKGQESPILLSSSDAGTLPDRTVSQAEAHWESFVGARSTAVRLKAEANVRRPTPKAPDGFAAAEAKDPIIINFTTSGSFGFDYLLGSTTIETDSLGQPLSPLSLFSDSPTGTVHLDFSAGLTGVQFNGMPLNGRLFVLSLDARGPVHSPSDLTIGFLPWAGLGLSQSDDDAVASYVESQLTTLPDGSVGLAPGQQFALFGSGSPLGSIAFDFSPGQATVSES